MKAVNKTVNDLLRTKGHAIWTIEPEATVFDALKILGDKDVGALLVLKDGKLAGIVSERDYARKVALRGKTSRDTKVREIMTEKVVTVRPEQSVDQCMALMTHHRIRHLPVAEGDQLVGVISIGDVVKAIIEDQEFMIEQLENYITGKR